MGQRLERAPGLVPGLARFFGARRRLALGTVVSGPLLWLVVVYLGSLALLVTSAFFRLDDFTGKSTSEWTIDNLNEAFTTGAYRTLVIRSILIAAAATIVCVLVALPVAFYISRLARSWAKRGLIVALTIPLWAGYLVKAYALRAIFEPGGDNGGGFLNSVFGGSPGFGYTATIVTLAYLWFPYMLLPIYTGFERLPDSLLDASSDLGAGTLRTFRSVIFPLLIPSIAAGSIFTFSLSLGDYITVKVVGGTTQMIGNIIERTLLAPNQPLAAAFTLWPIGIMIVYLVFMGRLGAFKNL